jgi:hypothetical protein
VEGEDMRFRYGVSELKDYRAGSMASSHRRQSGRTLGFGHPKFRSDGKPCACSPGFIKANVCFSYHFGGNF